MVDLFFSAKNPELFSRGINSLVARWQKIVDYFNTRSSKLLFPVPNDYNARI